MSDEHTGPQAPARTGKQGPKPKPYDPSLCGTPRGYKQHVKFRNERCKPCKDAYAAYQRGLRESRAKRRNQPMKDLDAINAIHHLFEDWLSGAMSDSAMIVRITGILGLNDIEHTTKESS